MAQHSNEVVRWSRLSARESDQAEESGALHEGIPLWLKKSLQAWVRDVFATLEPREEGQLELVGAIERNCRIELKYRRHSGSDLWNAKLAIEELFTSQHAAALDILDYLLHVLAERLRDRHLSYSRADELKAHLASLERVLREGGSGWMVDATAKASARLMRRVPPSVVASYRDAIARGGQSAEWMEKAWRAMYGREPDAAAARGFAIKAIESALKPVVLPADSSATLGRMLGELRKQSDRFVFALDDAPGGEGLRALTVLVDRIWKSQTDRHGSDAPATVASVSDEAGIACLQIALAVVQLSSTGVVARK